MTSLYAIALGVGVVLLIVWVVATVVAGAVEGWGRIDPERRFGRRGRWLVAALTGAGMGGMSSSYAGWPVWAAVGAAIAGGAGLVWVAGAAAETP